VEGGGGDGVFSPLSLQDFAGILNMNFYELDMP
jgi:hypothetical protein